MPNGENVTSPITLVGMGRSGTSLIQAAFDARSDFQVCGETGALIFSIWRASADTYMPLSPEHWSLADDPDGLATHYVQQIFARTFPSDAKYWFHKPVGIPHAVNLGDIGGFRSPLTNFPVEWYWKVLLKSFPNTRIITTVRNPFDVIVSRREHTLWAPQAAIRDVLSFYEIYDFGWDLMAHKALFGKIVQDFEGYLQSLCAALGLNFDRAMVTAQGINHAPVPNRGPKLDHVDAWDTLPLLTLSRAEISCIERVWDKLGAPLLVPPDLRIRPD